jgi:hypothetical protein
MATNQADSLSAPKGGAFAITPDDDNDLAIGATAIYVGVGGDIKVTTSLGQTVTFVGVVTGSVLPVRVKRVFDTDTTATTMIGLY